MGMSIITLELPATSKVESAVNLVGQGCRYASGLSSMGVSVTKCDGCSWVFCNPDEGRNVLLPNLE